MTADVKRNLSGRTRRYEYSPPPPINALVSPLPGTPPHEEPKFLVFYTMLFNVFTMFCFQCKSANPKVSMKRNGTMTVIQTCSKCMKMPFIWQSQPYVLGQYQAGNILFSFSVLMAGTSVSRVLLL